MFHQDIDRVAGAFAIVAGHVDANRVRDHILFYRAQGLQQLVGDGDGIGTGTLCYGNRYCRDLVVLRTLARVCGTKSDPVHGVQLSGTVTDLGDVLQIHRAMAVQRHHQFADILGVAQERAGTDLRFRIVLHQCAGGDVYIGSFKYSPDVGECNVVFPHPREIQIYIDLPLAAAVYKRDRGSLYSSQVL